MEVIRVQIDDRIFEGRPISDELKLRLFADSKGDIQKLTRSVLAATFGLDEATIREMPYATYTQLVAAFQDVIQK